MRNPNRIEPFMNTLTEFWKEVPDWRFGQLIENIKRMTGRGDLFYVEDDKFLTEITDILSEIRRNREYGSHDLEQ